MKKLDWKTTALRSARRTAKMAEKDTVDILTCPATDKEFAYVAEGKRYLFDSCGICASCKKIFHVTALKIDPDVAHSQWPIMYNGLFCEECFNKDN